MPQPLEATVSLAMADIPLQQIVDFVLELDKLKGVTRKSHPIGHERHENSAEHSWHITLFAMSLAHYSDTPLDIDKVIRMLLVHDIGEIDTGDTLVFVETGWPERKEAELVAVTRIFSMLPDGRGAVFLELWREFEYGDSAEACFARSVDRAIPVLINLASQGRSWKENGISYERVMGRVGPEVQAGCPALWIYLEARLLEARDLGFFGA
jgi:putative hydrolase of HD superfamily